MEDIAKRNAEEALPAFVGDSPFPQKFNCHHAEKYLDSEEDSIELPLWYLGREFDMV